MKNLCLIYATCQGRAVEFFLNKSESFCELYRIETIDNLLLIKSGASLPVDALRKADLFICQPVSARHGIYATENFIKYLSPQCKIISSPYIYNDALWPLFEGGGKIKGKEIIAALVEKGMSLKEIVDMFCAGKIDFQFARRFHESMAILRSTELRTDVMVADFIENKLSGEKLFLTENHQTSSVYMHCVNQILDILCLPRLSLPDNLHPNEAALPDCWPQSPYETEFYGMGYRCDWRTFHPDKKDSNWHRFHLSIIGKIYLSYPMPWFLRVFWKVYLRLRIKWSLMTGAGYLNGQGNLS